MLDNSTFLAIIPARGGSKRLPRKNILNLGGKSLISWTIEAALKSKYIDNTVVTSDDEEILKIANHIGSKTIKRPGHLANDTATTIEAIVHTISNLKNSYDYIILLQPTSPLRTEKHIDQAIELLESKNADSVISVCEMEHSPLWSNKLAKSGSMVDFISDDIKNKRSQDLDRYYRLNGAIYICDTQKLLAENSFFLKRNVFAYKMKKEHSIDIDEEFDFKIAKAYLV